MALTKKQKTGLKVFLVFLLLAGAIVTAYLLYKSKEPYNGSGPTPVPPSPPRPRPKPTPPKPSSGDDECCGEANTGVPIWDTCGHICGMSKHQGTDLKCLSNDSLTLWSTTGQKPYHWKHPNASKDHETCCGEESNKVPIWDTCGHICGYNKSKKDMDPNGITLWGNKGILSGGGYTASSTQAMCNSKARYMP